MDKNSLRKLISDKLGISSSKKEFAFEVFLNKISETLEADEAISVPGVGYFQLKNEPLVKEERKASKGQKKLTKRTIFFSPADSHDKEELSLFLSFDIDAPQKDFTEFDENIFSLGIQKPIAPIFDEDENPVSLEKSLESRIDAMVHNSEKLNDFDLFENYVNLIEGEESRENEIINEIHEDVLQDIPAKVFKEEIEPEEEFHEIEKPESGEEKQTEEIIEEEKETSPFDELAKLGFDEEVKLEENDALYESDSEEEQVLENKEIEESRETNKEVKKGPAPSFEDILENDDDLIDSLLPGGETENSKNYVEFEEEEGVEWDWGDELKAEFQEEPEEGVNKDLPDETALENLAEELENEFENIKIDEDDLDTEDESEGDADLETAKGLNEVIGKEEENLEDEVPEIIEDKVEKKERKGLSFKSYDWKKQNFGKGFWILLGTFVIFTILGLYYLLFWSGEKQHAAEIIDMQQTDTVAVKDSTIEQVIAKVDTTELIETEPIKTPVVETQPKEEKTLYRKVENDTRVSNRIYSDGKRYMIQISSFRSKNRAESDAARFLEQGFDTFIVEAYLPQLGGTWYRVRIGYFNSQKETEDFITKNKL